jgi:hypothetical protein
LLEAYNKPMTILMPLFIAGMARMVISTFTAKASATGLLLARIHSALAPHIGAYLGIGMIGQIYEIFGIRRAEKNAALEDAELKKDFFYTSPTQQSFYEYFALSEALQKGVVAEKDYHFQVGMLVAFLGAGIIGMELAAMSRDLKMSWRIGELKTIGFESGKLPTYDAERAVDLVTQRANDTIRAIKTDLPLYSEWRETRIREVVKARNSLLFMLEDEAKLNAMNLRQLGRAFSDLRMEPNLDLIKVRDAREHLEELYQDGLIDRAELERGRMAEREIRQLVKEAVDGNRPSMTGTLARAAENVVRQRLGRAPRVFENVAARILSELHGIELDTPERIELTRNYLQVLELDPESSPNDATITSAYRRLMRKYHPDRRGLLDPSETKGADQRYLDIQEAFSVLIPRPLQETMRDAS